MHESTYEDTERMEQDDDNEDEEEYKEYLKKYKLGLSWSIGPLSQSLLSLCFCMMNLFKCPKSAFKPWYELSPAWHIQFEQGAQWMCNGGKNWYHCLDNEN